MLCYLDVNNVHLYVADRRASSHGTDRLPSTIATNDAHCPPNKHSSRNLLKPDVYVVVVTPSSAIHTYIRTYQLHECHAYI